MAQLSLTIRSRISAFALTLHRISRIRTFLMPKKRLIKQKLGMWFQCHCLHKTSFYMGISSRNGRKQGLLNTPPLCKIYLQHSLQQTQVKSAIKKNINSTSTSYTRLRYSCPNWTFLTSTCVLLLVMYHINLKEIQSRLSETITPGQMQTHTLMHIIISKCINLLKFKEFHQIV